MKKEDLRKIIKEEFNKIAEASAIIVIDPVCPQCGHYNAMRPSEKKSNTYGEENRVCRDCGFEAIYSHKKKIDLGPRSSTYKRLDGEDGQLKEKSNTVIGENYIKNSIDTFISKSDQNSPYKPMIKLYWGGDNAKSETKWLSISWSTMIKLGNLLSSEEKS